MKPHFPAAVALTLVVSALVSPLLSGVAMAAQPAPSAQEAQAAADAQSAANERAGLPDLKSINRPAAEVSSKVEINQPRTPSYYERSGNGTEITEYRDKGKPVEIDVHSNFGTRYQMSAPMDTSPTVRDNGKASTRLPSVNLHY